MNFLVKSAYAYSASPWSSPCVGSSNLADVPTIQGIVCVLSNILAEIPPVLTLLAFFMVVFAGIRLMMAGSEPKAIAAAWSTFSMAVLGLVLMAGVWIILVVIERLTGAKVTTIRFP